MKKLHRARYDKKIAGVCGGLGNYFSIDPVFIRLLALSLLFLTAVLPVLIIYFVAALTLPVEPPNTPAFEFKRFYRSKNDRFLAGICGGLTDFFKIDSSVIRLITVVLTCLTGFVPLLIVYLAGWAIIPEKKL